MVHIVVFAAAMRYSCCRFVSVQTTMWCDGGGCDGDDDTEYIRYKVVGKINACGWGSPATAATAATARPPASAPMYADPANKSQEICRL